MKAVMHKAQVGACPFEIEIEIGVGIESNRGTKLH
jgi:hypothetical protein